MADVFEKQVLAPGRKSPGRYGPPFEVMPKTAQSIRVEVNRNAWDGRHDEVALTLDIEVSFDNGATWEFLVGFGTGGANKADGKPHLNRHGEVRALSAVQENLPPEQGGRRRRVRVVMDCVRDLDTSIRIIATDITSRAALPTSRGPRSVTTTGTPSSVAGTNTSSVSVSHTVPTGTDRGLAAFAGQGGPITNPNTYTSIVWDPPGVNETLTVRATDVLEYYRGTIALLVAPTEKTANIVLTLGGTDDEVALLVGNVVGLDQTTPVNATDTDAQFEGTNTLAVTLASAVGGLAVGGVVMGDTQIDIAADMTQIAEEEAIDSFVSASFDEQDGETTVEMGDWTSVGARNDGGVCAAMALNASVAAPAPVSLIMNQYQPT